MAIVTANSFAFLTDIDDQEGDIISKLNNDVRKARTSLASAEKKKKKKQQQQQAAKKKQEAAVAEMKPRQKFAHDHPVMNYQERVFRRPTYHQKPRFDSIENNQTDQAVERKTLSLKEYEKEVLEKKKVLNINNKGVVKKPDQYRMERQLDKDFESWKLVGKKREELMLDKEEKPKKKDLHCHTQDNKKRVHKSMDISGFLKPLIIRTPRQSQRTSTANGDGKFNPNGGPMIMRAEEPNMLKATAGPPTLRPNVEDFDLFPVLKGIRLGGAVKAST